MTCAKTNGIGLRPFETQHRCCLLVQEEPSPPAPLPPSALLLRTPGEGHRDSSGFPIRARLDRVGERPRRDASICGVTDFGGAVSARPNQGDDRSPQSQEERDQERVRNRFLTFDPVKESGTNSAHSCPAEEKSPGRGCDGA